MVRQEPGVHHNELVRRIGKGNGTVEHHVRLLLEQEAIVRVEAEGRTCYFLAGGLDGGLMQAASALRRGTRLAILRALAEAGPLRMTDVAARVGVSPATASHHLARLRRHGLVAPAAGMSRTPVQASPLGLRCVALLGRRETATAAARVA